MVDETINYSLQTISLFPRKCINQAGALPDWFLHNTYKVTSKTL